MVILNQILETWICKLAPGDVQGGNFPGDFVEARELVLDPQNLGGFNGLFRHFVGESGPKSLRGLIT